MLRFYCWTLGSLSSLDVLGIVFLEDQCACYAILVLKKERCLTNISRSSASNGLNPNWCRCRLSTQSSTRLLCLGKVITIAGMVHHGEVQVSCNIFRSVITSLHLYDSIPTYLHHSTPHPSFNTSQLLLSHNPDPGYPWFNLSQWSSAGLTSSLGSRWPLLRSGAINSKIR